MKKIPYLLILILITSNLFAQSVNTLTDTEYFITQAGSILETNLLYKSGKQYQNPYRKIDFSLSEYTNLDNDSVIKGIKLLCITDYLTKQTRSYYSFLDVTEINKLLDWIVTVEQTPLLKNNQAIYYIPTKGKLMLSVINSNGKKQFQYFYNKYDYSTAVNFNMEVIQSLQDFLFETKDLIFNK